MDSILPPGLQRAMEKAERKEILVFAAEGGFWGVGRDPNTQETIAAYGFGLTEDEATRDTRRTLAIHFYVEELDV